jgi:hypothetical protein
MKSIKLAFAITVALLAAPAAFAAPVSYDVSGIVEGTAGAYAEIPYYSDVTVTITEDVALAGSVRVEPNFIAYFQDFSNSSPLLVRGSFNLDGISFAEAAGPYLQTNDWINSTGPIARAPYKSSYDAASGIFFANGNSESIEYYATSTSADLYSLTSAMPLFESDQSGTVTVRSDLGGVNSALLFTVTGVKEVNVPAPASLGLLIVGLIGALRRRKAV